MKFHTTPAVVLVTTACIVAAVWTRANQASLHHWQSDSSSQFTGGDAPLRYPGELVSARSVPVPQTVTELEVPLNTLVRKDELIGQTQPQTLPEPAEFLSSRASLDAARAAVVQARAQFQDIQARALAARARAEDASNRMVGTEIAVGQADEVIQRDDLLYREGMESQLRHDEELSLQQSVRLHADRQSEAAGSTISRQEQLEAEEATARATLREAREQQRAAEAAALNPAAAAVSLPVLAPADGYLVLRDEFSGKLQVVSSLARQVETHIPQAGISSVHVGQLATVTLDSEPNVVLHAVVQKIGDVENSAAGQFCPVTLALTGAPNLGDDSARVTVTLQ
ncbi:MAG: HlyD family secretion protein [Acidobacteria bacterium]|nr:HlyD family secretion protein [Acidobacteriota bacterium]